MNGPGKGRLPARRYGLAIFAEWTTSGAEWAVWRHDWVSPGESLRPGA